MRRLRVISVAGTVTVQDGGRPGWLAQGLSRGGAVDPVAMAEGAALLGLPPGHAAIELMAGAARFAVDQRNRIALTGAPMRAVLHAGGEATTLAWNASHLVPQGAELAISPGPQGGFGYLHLGGGIASDPVMGSRSAHLAGGIGRILQAGDSLPLGPDASSTVDLVLDPLPRFGGGVLRAVVSLQTALYGADQIARLQETAFRRDSHGNRMGVRLDLDGAPPFAAKGGLSVVSEIVRPGDIQITGDGTPFVLMAECQTTGGYPRIANILPCDLPIVAQAAPGDTLRIRLVDRDDAILALRDAARQIADLPRRIRPRRRDPAEMTDLLRYNLIGGAIDARRPDQPGDTLHTDPDPQGAQ